jgi:GT2 family glycosyltransferase
MVSVSAIIVTHNPDEDRFGLVLSSAASQVSNVLVVDNVSSNRAFVEGYVVGSSIAVS